MNTEELLRLHCHTVCTPGLGHTTAAINGVKSTDAILICATSQHARDIRAEHQKCLYQVVGKGIVIINQQ